MFSRGSMYRRSAESHPSCDILREKGKLNGWEVVFNSLVSIHSAQRLAVPSQSLVSLHNIDQTSNDDFRLSKASVGWNMNIPELKGCLFFNGQLIPSASVFLPMFYLLSYRHCIPRCTLNDRFCLGALKWMFTLLVLLTVALIMSLEMTVSGVLAVKMSGGHWAPSYAMAIEQLGTPTLFQGRFPSQLLKCLLWF